MELNPSSKRFGTFLGRSLLRLGSSVTVVMGSLRLLLTTLVGGTLLLTTLIIGAIIARFDVAGGDCVVGVR